MYYILVFFLRKTITYVLYGSENKLASYKEAYNEAVEKAKQEIPPLITIPKRPILKFEYPTFPLPREPISDESLLNVYDYSPITDAFYAPELMSNVGGTNLDDFIYLYLLFVLGFLGVAIYINPHVYEVLTTRIQEEYDLNLGEQAEPPPDLFDPPVFMSMTAHDIVVYLYTSYDELTSETKAWYLFFNFMVVHVFTGLFVDTFLFLYYVLVFDYTYIPSDKPGYDFSNDLPYPLV